MKHPILGVCLFYAGTDAATVSGVTQSRCQLPRAYCLSSVTFVHSTQVIKIFGNVSTPFGTLAICEISDVLNASSYTYHGEWW